MLKHLMLFVILASLSISCSTIYKVSYDTYLKDSKQKDLKFGDDKFDFSFTPVSNGIWFTIKNNTNQTAYLVWDKSYFITPSGNSFKALDYDAISVTDEVARKENNESPIPAHSTFARFTTSNTNITKFKNYSSTDVNNFFNNYSYLTTINNDFFDIDAYWEPTFICKLKKPENIEDFLDKKCADIKEDVLLNNKLGLGLFIKLKDENYEYRFDIKIRQVDIYKIDISDNILKRSLRESDNFEFNKIK